MLITLARIQVRPDEQGPVAVIQMNTEARIARFNAFWDGGVWGDGDQTKVFRDLEQAFDAVATEVVSLEDN